MNKQIGRNLSILNRQTNHFLNEALRPLSINRSQMSILLLLSGSDGLSQAEINEHLLFNKASITKMLSGLEKSGYVTRSRGKQDKRINKVFLTEKGKDTLPHIRKAITQWEAVLAQDLTQTEQSELKLLLRKIIESILKRDGK